MSGYYNADTSFPSLEVLSGKAPQKQRDFVHWQQRCI